MAEPAAVITPSPSPLPVAPDIALIAPSAAACLRCQLLGRRKLLCAREDVCRSLPHVFALGPVLLVGWAALAVAFFVALW